MRHAVAAAPLPGGAFYSAKNWVGICPPCPPATYAPVTLLVAKIVIYLKHFLDKNPPKQPLSVVKVVCT
jgi:hypothetical protein